MVSGRERGGVWVVPMAERSSTTGPGRFEVTGRVDTHFSWIRTRMSLERTMMSWLRTGSALIGFGFTIFQFLENFNRAPDVGAAKYPHSPEVIGLTFIGGGVVALIVAAREYHFTLQYLWNDEFAPVAGMRDKPGTTPVLWVAVLLILAGLFAFVAVLLRLR